jgi:hypothetical protein
MATRIDQYANRFDGRGEVAMRPLTIKRLTFAGLVVAVIGVLIAAASYVHDLRADGTNREKTTALSDTVTQTGNQNSAMTTNEAPVVQNTSGPCSPAVNGNSGSVAINGKCQ